MEPKKKRAKPSAAYAAALHKRFSRPEEVAFEVGSKKLFEAMRAAGWLKPLVQRNNLVLFDEIEVSRACERVRKEGWPPAPRGK